MSCRAPLLGPLREHASFPKSRKDANVDVAGDGHGLEETLDLPIFGHVGNAVAHGRGRDQIADGPIVKEHLAAMEEVALQKARDDLERLRPAGSDEAEDSGNLAGENGK